MNVARTDRLQPWLALRHPLWLVSLALLVVNDHLLKGAGVLPSAIRRAPRRCGRAPAPAWQ